MHEWKNSEQTKRSFDSNLHTNEKSNDQPDHISDDKYEHRVILSWMKGKKEDGKKAGCYEIGNDKFGRSKRSKHEKSKKVESKN